MALAHPELVVVTPDGDRLDGAGRLARRAAPPSGRRRRRPTRRAGKAVEAGDARDRAEAALADARTALDEARRWEAAGDKALDSHRARQAAVAAARRAAPDRTGRGRSRSGRPRGARRRAGRPGGGRDRPPAGPRGRVPGARGRRGRGAPAGVVPPGGRRSARGRDPGGRRRPPPVRPAGGGRRRAPPRPDQRLEEVEARLVRHGEARQQAEERRAALAHRGDAYAAIDRAIAGAHRRSRRGPRPLARPAAGTVGGRPGRRRPPRGPPFGAGHGGAVGGRRPGAAGPARDRRGRGADQARRRRRGLSA